MRGMTDTFHRWCGIFAVMVIGLVSQAGCADAQRPAKTVFSVSDDQTLSYPPSIRYLPDEHTTVLPLTELEIPEHPTFVAPQELSRNLFFVSMSNVIRNVQYDGAFVLEVANDGVTGRGHRAGMGLRLAALEALQSGGVVEFGMRGPGTWQVRLVVPDEL